MSRIAIVGGGIAGLALGHALVRGRAAIPDVDVVVLEHAARAGGHLQTDRVDGFLCEHGPNGFLDNAPATRQLIADLGLADRVQVSEDRARRRFLYLKGKLHEVPSSPGGLLRTPLLSWTGKLRLLGEPFAPRKFPGLGSLGQPGTGDDETIYDFAARRFGTDAARVFADAIVSGVFGGDAHQLSMRACFPGVSAMEGEHGSVLRGALAARRRARTAPPPVSAELGRLTSFRNGIVELVDALVASLGPRVRTGARVKDVVRDGAGFRLTLDDASRLHADALVLACGPAASARLVSGLDAALARELREISSPPIAVVCLGFPVAASARPLDGFGFLVPRGQGVRTLGVLWDSSIYPGRAPRDHVLLRAMIGGATDPDAAGLADEELVAHVRRELAETMQVTGVPVLTRVFRHRPGIPQYNRGHLERLTRIDARLQRHPRLHLIGNAWRGVSINHCIEEASTVASRLLASGAAFQAEGSGVQHAYVVSTTAQTHTERAGRTAGRPC